MKNLLALTLFAALLAASLPARALTLSSPAFANNGVVPNEYTYSLSGQCSGANLSPPLSIGAVPAGTQSFALTVVDPDGGNWLHWKAWNIPATATAILANASAIGGFNQASNEFGTPGYGGPCPPTPNHRYIFTLYAVNTIFSTEPSTTQLQAAAIQTATLTGLRSPTDNVATGAAVSTSDCLFNWAERTYPQFFSPAASVSSTIAQYYFRYYAGATTYLATSSPDNRVWVLGPVSGNQPMDVGAVASFLGVSGCQ